MPKIVSASMRALGICLGIGVVSFAQPLSAHHSFAMYDSGKQITIEGVVKEFQWTNPHVWIEVMVPTPPGVRMSGAWSAPV
jgi:hypothetical protein